MHHRVSPVPSLLPPLGALLISLVLFSGATVAQAEARVEPDLAGDDVARIRLEAQIVREEPFAAETGGGTRILPTSSRGGNDAGTAPPSARSGSRGEITESP